MAASTQALWDAWRENIKRRASEGFTEELRAERDAIRAELKRRGQLPVELDDELREKLRQAALHRVDRAEERARWNSPDAVAERAARARAQRVANLQKGRETARRNREERRNARVPGACEEGSVEGPDLHAEAGVR